MCKDYIHLLEGMVLNQDNLIAALCVQFPLVWLRRFSNLSDLKLNN